MIAKMDSATRWNDAHHGLTWTANPGSTCREAVTDFCQAFGWNGVTVSDVCNAVGGDSWNVRRVLKLLLDDGQLYVRLTETRGPKASKRQIFYSFTDSPHVPLSDLE